MALTNFAALTAEQLTVWSRTTWKNARNASFLNRFLGSDTNSMIQRITELKKTEKGARAVITLVADLEGDGTAGDRQLEGNEEAMKSFDQVIQIDQLRHANRHQGRIADQQSVVSFRTESRDVLGYWLGDRMDQMAFLTLTGVAYTFNNDGSTRVGSDLPFLEFAGDVTAPTANRHQRWDDTSGLEAGSTAAVAATDLPSWEMLVRAKAFVKKSFMRPIRGEGPFSGNVLYNVFMAPDAIAHLKLDTDFLSAWRNAMPRSPNNPLFKDTEVYFVDNLAIREFFHVFNTLGATSTVDKWGAGSDVDGSATLICGAQALGFADIGDAFWVEKKFDYDNQPGISYGKIMGMKKPVFRSHVSGTDEDFSVLRLDHAI